MSTSTYTLLSGQLPQGLELSSTGTIYGTPISVLNTTTNRFVIRKSTNNLIEDITYSITIEGSDPPVWVTTAGYLEVGQDNEEYIFNNQYLYYQLEAVPNNAPIDTIIRYYIGDNDGVLPPGLTLSKDGLISGFVTDTLDLTYYGITPIEFPKVYEFTVTATDSVHQSKRTFKIVVTSPNVLNYNDTEMPIDITLPTLPPGEIYAAAPQWLMSSDLGRYRASNNNTIQIKAHDAYPQDGTLTYLLIDNVDEYQTIPNGLHFDPITGYIYGYLPHIPALEQVYEITIDAIKTVGSTTKISRNIFSLTVAGDVEKTITWETDSYLGTIDLGSTSELYVKAISNNSKNKITYSLITGELPQGLSLAQDGSIVGSPTTSTYIFPNNQIYKLKAPSNITEGETISYILETKNVEEGTEVNYVITGVQSSDFLGSPPLTGTFVVTLPPEPRYTNYDQLGHWKIVNNPAPGLSGPFFVKGKEIIVSEESYWNTTLGIVGTTLTNAITAAHSAGFRAGINLTPYAESGDGVIPATATRSDLLDLITDYNIDFVCMDPYYFKTNEMNVWTVEDLEDWTDDIITTAQNEGKYIKIVVQGFYDSGLAQTVNYRNRQLSRPNIEEFINFNIDGPWTTIPNAEFKDQKATTSTSFTLVSQDTVEREILTMSINLGGDTLDTIKTAVTDNPASTSYNSNPLYGYVGTYTFTVMARDIYELSAISREFTLEVTQASQFEHTKIFIKPFLTRQKRRSYLDFITNQNIFDYKSIYRYFDPNFGIQNEIKIILEFGIEKLNLQDYVVALRENFYRKDFYFGAIKKAIAKKDNQVVYELIYAEVIDPMITVDNLSVSKIVYRGYDDIYYPSSITNMKNQLRLITTEDNLYIDVNDDLQPRFMKTRQTALEDFLGYIRVIPICYALPGQGDKMISRIKLSGFDLKQFHFEVDRIIIQNPLDYSSAKYLLLERQSINDPIPTDNQLFGSDYDADTLTVRLDDEDGNPLARKN